MIIKIVDFLSKNDISYAFVTHKIWGCNGEESKKKGGSL